MKRISLVLGWMALLLLSACSPAKGNLVGRWEYFSNEEHTAGAVFEFHEDDTCLYYEFDTAARLLYPPLAEKNVTRYKANSDSLELIVWSSRNDGSWRAEGTETATEEKQDTLYTLSFPSADELQVTLQGESEGRTFQRAALPEMPLDARLLLGRNLLYQELAVINAERLTGTWQDAYPGYVEVSREHFVEKEAPEQWAVFVQQDSNPDVAIYLLVEGESGWGLIRLEKSE